MLTLNIIGCGNLGRTLARLWHQQQQFQIRDLVTASPASASRACEFIGAGRPRSDLTAMAAADCWLLATPDDAIAATAARLAESGLVSANSIVFHCSGSLASDTLAPLAGSTAHLASIHPVHTFAVPAESVTRFAGTYCAYEGEPVALAGLLPAFKGIGAELIAIEAATKIHYHAASVMACNYLVALLDASLECYANAGIDAATASKMLLPIVHQTVDNSLLQSPQRALTGPIARADGNTVERQLQALTGKSELLANLYRQLGLQALQIARRRTSASPQLDKIEQLLRAPAPDCSNKPG